MVDDIVAILPPLCNAGSPVCRTLFEPAVSAGYGSWAPTTRCAWFARAGTGLRNSTTSGERKPPAMRRWGFERRRAKVAMAIVSVFRAALRPRAQEALYALSQNAAGQRILCRASLRETPVSRRGWRRANENSGIFHDHNEPGSRGGFSLYVPEYYTPDRAWPLVTALHGGSGNGRGFLWSWLRDARSHGAIVIAPTATGNDSGKTTPIKNTWALMGDDTDTPNLTRILDWVRSRWNIDSERMLLTGMSDGGTFCYVTGFDRCPFTICAGLATSSAMAESRMEGCGPPIYIARPADSISGAVARQTRCAVGGRADVTASSTIQPLLSTR